MGVSCQPIDMVLVNDRKSYVPLATVVIEHILQASELKEIQKLYYLLVDMYSHINLHGNGLRETEKSGVEWARLLNCSEQWVFAMQKRMEYAGYFVIKRERDTEGQNEKNILIPTLPECVLKTLSTKPCRYNKTNKIYSPAGHAGYSREALDNTKLYTRVNLPMFKSLAFYGSLTVLQKSTWIMCYLKSYQAYINATGEGRFSAILSMKELAVYLSCSESAVSKALEALQSNGFVKKSSFRIHDPAKASRRKKKILWDITTLFPENIMKKIKMELDRSNLSIMTKGEVNCYNIPKVYGSFSTKEALNSQTHYNYIKDITLKPKYIKNIEGAVTLKNSHDPSQEQEINLELVKQQQNISQLPGDKAEKASKFAHALKQRKLATGYAAKIDAKMLTALMYAVLILVSVLSAVSVLKMSLNYNHSQALQNNLGHQIKQDEINLQKSKITTLLKNAERDAEIGYRERSRATINQVNQEEGRLKELQRELEAINNNSVLVPMLQHIPTSLIDFFIIFLGCLLELSISYLLYIFYIRQQGELQSAPGCTPSSPRTPGALEVQLSSLAS